MVCDFRERRLCVHHVVERHPKNMGCDHMAARDRIVVYLADVPTDRPEEAVDLAERMMEPTSTCPSVASTEDRFVPIFGANAVKFGSQHVNGDVPLDLDECLMASPLWVGSGSVAIPALTDRRPGDPAPPYGLERLPDGRRIRVLRKGMDGGDVVAVGLDFIRAPVRQRQVSLSLHRSSSHYLATRHRQA